MSKTFLGAVCAYIPKQPGMNKALYPRVGSAFTDDTTGQISLKIDTMPIAQSNWEGWLNVYPPKESAQTTVRAAPAAKRPHWDDPGDDDIPF